MSSSSAQEAMSEQMSSFWLRGPRPIRHQGGWFFPRGMAQIDASMSDRGFADFTSAERPEGATAFWAHQFPDFSSPVMGGEIPTTHCVLLGAQGTGKTTLFNRLTNSQQAVSAGLMSCTRTNATAQCVPPFRHVELTDTPGMAWDNVDYNDSFQLREAFIRKPINLIVLVCAFPTETRVAALISALKPLDTIMRCSTFLMSQSGLTAEPGSAERTRVLLVLTHRDRTALPRDHWETYVRSVRLVYDWVGSVVMVDPAVPLNHLLANVVLPACCMQSRDFNIPMTEFCSRFPISRGLTAEEELQVNNCLLQFSTGMNAAIGSLEAVKAEKVKEGFAGSASHTDKVGPTMDCVLRFLDDLYDRKTLEALAILENENVDNLWVGTDMDVNLRRVERWNCCKAKFGESYQRTKVMLQQHFPTRPIDAVYKKCNHCKAIFVKPVGCDFATVCGQSVGGADSLPYTYDYTERTNTFTILGNCRMGGYESVAFALRKNFAVMVSRNTDRFYYGTGPSEVRDASDASSGAALQKGCGRPIKWETMQPLTIEELIHFGLVPDGVPYEVTPPEQAGVDLSMTQKLARMVAEMGLTPGGSMVIQVRQLFVIVGIDPVDQPANLQEQVDMLYNIIIDVSE